MTVKGGGGTGRGVVGGGGGGVGAGKEGSGGGDGWWWFYYRVLISREDSGSFDWQAAQTAPPRHNGRWFQIENRFSSLSDILQCPRPAQPGSHFLIG